MRHFFIFILVLAFPITLLGQKKIEVTWYNAVDLGIDGKGWMDTKAPYDRLPPRAELVVTE